MQKQGIVFFFKIFLLAIIASGVVFGGRVALAQTLTSPNYQMTETQLGSGSTTASCSGHYCARVSIGSWGNEQSMLGPTASFDNIPGSDPLLELIVDAGESNLGDLSTELTGKKTAIIRIRHYNSGGYQLQLIGDPPKFEGRSLNALTTPTPARAGTEQFGVNIATNTAPVVGIDPVQLPAGSSVFGVVADDYKTPNYFKYVSGDVIARSTTESGRTDYTVSMIVNISSSTPPGHYVSDFQAVVVPAF